MKAPAFVLGILAAWGCSAAGEAVVPEAVRGLSSPSFEERERSLRRLSAEAARLEKEGDGKGLSSLLDALRSAAAGEDPEAAAAARRILAPFTAGNPRWRRETEVLPGRATAVLALPEGILATNVTPDRIGGGFLSLLEESVWAGLYAPDTGEPIWEARFGEKTLLQAVFDAQEGKILIAGSEVQRQACWARILDAKTGKILWEMPQGAVQGFLQDGFATGTRVVLAGMDPQGDGRVWCLDRKASEKPVWTVAIKGQPILQRAPSEWAGEPALVVAGMDAESGVRVLRLSDGGPVWRDKGEGMLFNAARAVPAGVVLSGYLLDERPRAMGDPAEGRRSVRLLSGKTGDVLWDIVPRGHVFEARLLGNGVWLGGNDTGDLEGPWWMGLYDPVTGKPRWEVTGVTFPEGTFPHPHFLPDGILVGERAVPGAPVMSKGSAFTLYDAATGKPRWRRTLEGVPADLEGVALLTQGLVAVDPGGISLIRLADAE